MDEEQIDKVIERFRERAIIGVIEIVELKCEELKKMLYNVELKKPLNKKNLGYGRSYGYPKKPLDREGTN